MLLIFLGKTAGIFGLFSFLKEENHESVFNRKGNELNLVKLIIPKTKKIHWEREDEVIYEGKYYDIFKKTEDVKNIYLLCYSDIKDNQLTEMFHKNLSDDNNLKGKPGDRLLKTALENCLLECSEWSIHPSLPQKISIQTLAAICCGFSSVFSPPPDFLVC